MRQAGGQFRHHWTTKSGREFQARLMLLKLRGMRLKEISKKSRAVLKALVKGRSYEKVLAADRTLTAHDVFRALSESPTGFWAKRPDTKTNGKHADT